MPVTVKMRRGLENGSRACLELGPRLVEAGASSLTLHPRSAKQMYTGEADHSLTAELVELVDVPVIASGDVTSRARAQAILATTGAAAVMVGRAAQGNPWALREILDGDAAEPTREEVVAELILFIRETVRELGERRATGFLKKFYGWYLGRGRFPRPFKQELVQLETLDEVETRLLAAAPGAAEVWSSSRPSCRTARTTSCSTCRSRSTAAAEPSTNSSDEAGDLVGSERDQVVDPVGDRLDPRVRQRRPEALDRLGGRAPTRRRAARARRPQRSPGRPPRRARAGSPWLIAPSASAERTGATRPVSSTIDRPMAPPRAAGVQRRSDSRSEAR